LRFLADENVHSEIVRWLRGAGLDVAYAAESAGGEPDAVLLDRARSENRVFVTADKDFGELVVRRRLATPGVLPLRLRVPSVRRRIDRLAAAWSAIEPRLSGGLVVVGDRTIRSRALPSDGG